MRVYVYSNNPEAQKVKHLLESQDMPCEIHSFENWGYDGVFRGQVGMGEIVVPDDQAERAKEVIEKFKAEERDKPFEGDAELNRIKLEQRIEQLGTLRYVIYIVFAVLAYYLLFSMGLFGIIGAGLLSMGLIYGIAHLKKELAEAKKELDKIQN